MSRVSWLASLVAGVLALAFTPAATAAPIRDDQVPQPLQPWIGWVLHEQDQRPCPLLAESSDARLCLWPSRLTLDLNAGGGGFVLDVSRYTPGWVLLPGDASVWPQAAREAAGPLPVIEREGRPAAWVGAGRHRLEGRFEWPALPTSLGLPPGTALLSLSVGGQPADILMNQAGALALDRSDTLPGAAGESLSLRVFRRYDDEIPARLVTRLELAVSGAVRNQTLGPVLPDGFRPLTLGGDLPARLADDGLLQIQLRPGVWSLEIEAHALRPIERLAAVSAPAPWPEVEFWSLQAHPELRLIEVSGAAAIDPLQSGLPPAWTALPAYRLAQGEALEVVERQRGGGAAEQSLGLERQLWLDHSGRGFTVQDRLYGRLGRDFRLDTEPVLQLGRAEVDGVPQPVTLNGDRRGVELRSAGLDLTADSRIEGGGRLPVSGWSPDLDTVETTLHLPPGWRLLAAPGVDRASQTWIGRWTLLDLFVVLVSSIAALRLLGRATALLTLVTLSLTWHLPGAPQWSWVMLLVALALLRAVPEGFDSGGRLRRLLQAFRLLSAATLVFISLPFALDQARWAVFPQLEPTDDAAYRPSPGLLSRAQEAPMVEQSSPATADAVFEPELEVGGLRQKPFYPKPFDPDPGLLTQTGPGVPDWTWRQVTLAWNGPVTADQPFRLWLMPPVLTRLLSVLVIVLVAALLSRWLGWPARSLSHRGARLVPLVAVLAGLPLLHSTPLLAQDQVSEQGPDQGQDSLTRSAQPSALSAALLDELRQRLLAPPACAPQCVVLPRLSLAVVGERLEIRLTVDAAVPSALPLPLPARAGNTGKVWQPGQVLRDGAPADLLRDDQGSALLAVPAGRSEVLLAGSLDGVAVLQLPLVLRPRRVVAETGDWLLVGLDAAGTAENALELLRPRAEAKADEVDPEPAAQDFPPLLVLSRTFDLGLVWEVTTVAERQGSVAAAQVLEVPLLAGEAVTAGPVRPDAENLQISFAPGQARLSWTSRLTPGASLELVAQGHGHYERWTFDISPAWRVGFAGLPPTQTLENERYRPSFQPWPGERLSLSVERPAGAPGQTLTLDESRLSLRPGRRSSEVDLQLVLRSGQGSQHRLGLPEGYRLERVSLDGRPFPARIDDGQLVLALSPGTQELDLSLTAERPISIWLRTPAFDLGLPGVNAHLSLELPGDRWVLWTQGPRSGPAVVFWGYLAVLLALAGWLGAQRWTPLNRAHWALLLIGLSQLPFLQAGVVVGWLFALGARGRFADRPWLGGTPRRFNLAQVLLGLLTVFALCLLVAAVAQGLLGTPDMQIAGNGSRSEQLNWYQDRHGPETPTAGVFSVSIWWYRGLMLVWALWLADALVRWLRWGWVQYSASGLWKPVQRTPIKEPTP